MSTSTVDLSDDAAAEVARLAAARALLRNGDERALARLEGDAIWIAVARRRRLKRALGRHACLVWRVAVEDASGRRVESRLVPLLVGVPPGTGRFRSDPACRAWLASLVRDADGLLRARVQAECHDWLAAASRVAGAFTSARLARERAIAAPPPAAADEASQPGLFDRRAERVRQARAADAADAERAAGSRLRTITGFGTMATQPPRLLLAIVP